MNPRPGIETCRNHIGGAAITRAAHNHLTATLRWAQFDPVNVVTIYLDLAETNGLFDDQIRSDWGFPRAVGSSLNLGHRSMFRFTLLIGKPDRRLSSEWMKVQVGVESLYRHLLDPELLDPGALSLISTAALAR